jgi:hypothetical protein
MIAKKPQTEMEQRKKTAKNKINVKYELNHKFADRRRQQGLYLSFAVLCKQGDGLKKIKLAHN